MQTNQAPDNSQVNPVTCTDSLLTEQREREREGGGGGTETERVLKKLINGGNRISTTLCFYIQPSERERESGGGGGGGREEDRYRDDGDTILRNGN